jgi:hypothetical protein
MPQLNAYELKREQMLEGARGLTRYYQARIQEDDWKIWQTGLSIASEFLKLLEDGTQNPRDFDTLVQLAEDFRDNGSAALDLQLHISGWQRVLQVEQQLQSDDDISS